MYQAKDSRYETMQYNRCGQSGLKLPEVSPGFWHNFGTYCDYENMKALCFTALDNGITHFDPANNYGPEPGSTLEEKSCASCITYFPAIPNRLFFDRNSAILRLICYSGKEEIFIIICESLKSSIWF